MEIETSDNAIPCCLCGTMIKSNPANMCLNCLKTQVDITEGIPKQQQIFWCRGCGRYQRNTGWIFAEFESKELLTLLLKKIKNLNKIVKLKDATFQWTEPHSRRLKVKLTIQKEVFNFAVLQQTFVVEYMVQNLQCPECQRSYTEHVWKASCQVRQKVKHKRTFFLSGTTSSETQYLRESLRSQRANRWTRFFLGEQSRCSTPIRLSSKCCTYTNKDLKATNISRR